MGLETAVKAALEGVEGLRGHVYTAEALRDESVFAFYRLRSQDEPETLDGDSGLPEAELEVHVVADSYRVMTTAAAQAVTALKALRGSSAGDIYVEKVHVSQQSPDLKEVEVNKYRRMYVLRIAYQEGA